MKRYNQVRDGSYEPRSEMVEEDNGDWVWYEDVEHLEAINAELLEALEWLVKIQSIVSIPEAMHRPTYQKAVEQARSAIAKAEGDEK